MATLRVDTVSGIGTEGTVLKGGLRFRSKNYLTLPKGNTNQRDNDGGGRAAWAGGEVLASPYTTDTIDYIDLTSQGNAVDFGDLNNATRTHMSTSNGHGGL